MVARVEPAPERFVAGLESEGLRRATTDLYKRLVSLTEGIPDELAAAAESLTDPRQLVYLVASTVPFDRNVRQEILELDPVDAKLRRLVELLQHEVTVRELGQRITSETQERLSKTQRDYFLREQLRSIQQELGEEEGEGDVSDLRRRLEEANMPEEAWREAERELNRLTSIPSASPEYGIIRTYLDWMASIPWNIVTGGDIDIPRARDVLNEDHYDLEKIKDRILEYLAVRKLRQDRETDETFDRVTPANVGVDVEGMGEIEPEPEPSVLSETPTDRAAREPILCFVGPPGVGKTSLGQSIARALERKFVRISLGGVHDEAEVRGHRRTYIGALPGRIVQAIRRAETRDPVFMLDEIDKVGADWRGDPSSALLEVLDPAQNHAFVDNYLGISIDLSQILFIATANTTDTIPAPLLDRMEVIPLSGYTDGEKVQIAQQYLVPKQVRAHGLLAEEVAFDDDAIRAIVRGYTREAGVRSLEREIATACRKVARDIAEGKPGGVRVTAANVADFLGRPRFFDEVAERTDRPGVATGLAWTPTGGDVLFVEATMMPSHDERLILTGMLGDVMRESAQAALSYVRSNARELPRDRSNRLRRASGSYPRSCRRGAEGRAVGWNHDDDRAASLATGRPVRNDVAMTGEITLRGKILPVGGIREKVLAAQRAGIKTIILPQRNERDLEDVPAELREKLEFVFVTAAEEALPHALRTESTNSAVASGSGENSISREA